MLALTRDSLLARGHELTLLNRGQSAPALFPGVARLALDRRDITPQTLGDGTWDVVVDMNAYFPREIEAAVSALRGRVLVGYDGGRLVMGYEGGVFPSSSDTTQGYGLLVVDDTSSRAEGVLVYESPRPPANFPRLGVVSGGSTTLPLFGVQFHPELFDEEHAHGRTILENFLRL